MDLIGASTDGQLVTVQAQPITEGRPEGVPLGKSLVKGELSTPPVLTKGKIDLRQDDLHASESRHAVLAELGILDLQDVDPLGCHQVRHLSSRLVGGKKLSVGWHQVQPTRVVHRLPVMEVHRLYPRG